MTVAPPSPLAPRHSRFEAAFASAAEYANPLQEASLSVMFTSPSGVSHYINGFWDGGRSWRARFKPNELGEWMYTTTCSDTTNGGLHAQIGRFVCVEPAGDTRFDQHGPLRVSANRRFLEHADGTPFLWLSDTAWSGPLLSTDDEWAHYLRERVRQRFSAVQWVATQYLAAPNGDREGQLPYTGHDQIAINPAFYQRLDRRLNALNAAGLLGAPVLLWAAEWSEAGVNNHNPGLVLPEDQAVLLARYMVARWGAHDVVWILNGDGNYRGPKAERWHRIGQALFGTRPHAPVVLHPSGMNIPTEEFRTQEWLDITGYQSGHGDDEETQRWLVSGPPAQDWQRDPPRPSINLEPPYENHIAYQSQQRISPFAVRRALYWSLLVAPTAGVSYGGHGVWGWDDGTTTPVAHPKTGVPLPWREALVMPAAEQLHVLAELFGEIEWWRLRPAPELLLAQLGQALPSRTVLAARSNAGDLALIYTPEAGTLKLKIADLRLNLAARWVNPSTGERFDAPNTGTAGHAQFTPPAPGDWVLLMSE
jgi:hypothetical protein